MKKKFFTNLLVILVLIPLTSCSGNEKNDTIVGDDSKMISEISLPLGGNAFSSTPFAEVETITKNGIEYWTNSEEYFTAYFRISEPGVFEFSINKDSLVVLGKATLEFTINDESKSIEFNDTKKNSYPIGRWEITEPGYVALKIKGISKNKSHFPSISRVTINSSIAKDKIAFVQNDEASFYHWGRRGPSVHLNYQVPEKVNAEWYYNEVTVPKGQDIIGSYYMANGFAEGYFGIQVNSDKERRVLFSVWSPFVTDDPATIPDSKKIKLLNKGENVTTGEFGNEGSGGQSYLKYNWIAGNTYKFLLRGIPQNDNSTTYTAYFFAPELNKWQLIASFNRPETNTYLKRFHSFLENFSPEQGNKSREVLFNNQWYCDATGNWTEINSAKFTTDNTGTKGYRMDYSGGLLNNESFYLKNGGFFNNFTKAQSVFTRPLHQKKPVIDFSKLP
ncbi:MULTISPECIES: DUF3472 domain-containing protein [unclassified Flavobacterium]|uniref:DUF3472 domain-containing protein n=1 Tax=unclassified Flavobacterium TaxID=196869 RepID=UPI001E4CEB5C|nr:MULTISPECIES: DUF3472 domain-containing protein [unclassified Flavobacterium]